MNNNFCPGCGQKNTENGLFCVNCGCQLGQQIQSNDDSNMTMSNPDSRQPVMAGVENLNLDGSNNFNSVNQNIVNKPTSNKGITGLILGIIAFFIFGFLAFVGLPLSITALSEAKANGGTGKGVAAAGIVICSIDCVLIVMGFILKLLSFAI